MKQHFFHKAKTHWVKIIVLSDEKVANLFLLKLKGKKFVFRIVLFVTIDVKNFIDHQQRENYFLVPKHNSLKKP